jgi:hypothetical protein
MKIYLKFLQLSIANYGNISLPGNFKNSANEILIFSRIWKLQIRTNEKKKIFWKFAQMQYALWTTYMTNYNAEFAIMVNY